MIPRPPPRRERTPPARRRVGRRRLKSCSTILLIPPAQQAEYRHRDQLARAMTSTRERYGLSSVAEFAAALAQSGWASSLRGAA